MPKPRKPLVLLDEASHYYFVSHCVHLTFLNAVDSSTGQWIADPMKHLAGVFALELINKWRQRLYRVINSKLVESTLSYSPYRWIGGFVQPVG